MPPTKQLYNIGCKVHCQVKKTWKNCVVQGWDSKTTQYILDCGGTPLKSKPDKVKFGHYELYPTPPGESAIIFGTLPLASCPEDFIIHLAPSPRDA
jgi:hypothetical protein